MRVTDEEFIEVWNQYNSASQVSKALGLTIRHTHSRRRDIESKHSIVLTANDARSPTFNITIPQNGVRVNVEMDDGVIMVASDCHYYPGIISTAHKAFVKLIPMLSPACS
jgi:hypothetical protein